MIFSTRRSFNKAILNDSDRPNMIKRSNVLYTVIVSNLTMKSTKIKILENIVKNNELGPIVFPLTKILENFEIFND